MDDKFRFPDCMHALAAAFHMQHINPGDVTISLPHEKWWALLNTIDRKYSSGFVNFDGRGAPPTSFHYMGFEFKADVPKRQQKAA
jgi:hypothetical protein